MSCGCEDIYDYFEGENFNEFFLWDIDGVAVDLTGYSGELVVSNSRGVTERYPVSFGSFSIDEVNYTMEVNFPISLEKGSYDLQLQIQSPSGANEVWNLPELKISNKL